MNQLTQQQTGIRTTGSTLRCNTGAKHKTLSGFNRYNGIPLAKLHKQDFHV
jgi:hypothetical protein